MANQRQKLYRSRDNKILAGVAGGLGEYFDVDATFFRILFVILVFTGGVGIILYLVLILIMPEEPSDRDKAEDEQNSPRTGEDVEKSGESLDVDEARADSERRAGKNILGWGLVLLGVALLLNAAFPEIFAFSARFFWPIVVLLLGLFLIFRKQ